ncbi:hypothetical protein [Luteolibacter soli]|uniref:Uncharacterized protein n=1 Tax=Luteolibacter soli TaxID=3135280 RepID=A0ABU9B2I8_9BACT
MSTDPLDELAKGSLPDDPEARHWAWLGARAAFVDASPSRVEPVRVVASRWRFFAPVTSIAALLIACVSLWVVLHRNAPVKAPRAVVYTNADLSDFFVQGRSLFGERLTAVTVINGEPTWQLSEPGEAQVRQPVVAIVRITDSRGSQVQVAALPGMPVNIPFDGKDLQIEFLPTGNDQLLVTGPSLVWSSEQGASPLSSSAIAPLP